MTTVRKLLSILFIIALTVTQLISQTKKTAGGDPELAKKIARFAPTVLTADTARLNAKDKLALNKIIEAAKLLDPLFLRQVWSGNAALESKLWLTSQRSVVNVLLFLHQRRSWSRLDSNEPFIDAYRREAATSRCLS